MYAHLVLRRADGKDSMTFPLIGTETVVGRGFEADVTLDDAYLLRRQAVIRKTADGWVMKDLGRPQEGEIRLEDGAAVRRYGRYTLVFRIEDESARLADTKDYIPDPVVVARVAAVRKFQELGPGELQVFTGIADGKSWKLSRAHTLIGTSHECDIRLGDPYMSDIHLHIEKGGTGFRVIDRDSSNGTWLDGVRVTDAPLEFGATIGLGKTSLRFRRGAPAHRGRTTSLSYQGLIGDSAGMRDVYAKLEEAAQLEIPVLLVGECGTGKELAAAAIHKRSRRAGKPFRVTNAAAIEPGNGFERELFGAHFRSLFELADGGTLFLDEVGSLPPPIQAKLLHYLETGTITRIGGEHSLKADVRLIASTNRLLDQIALDKTFSHSTFERLYPLQVQLPPLRQHPEDIWPLVEHFLRQPTRLHPNGVPGITRGALTLLEKHPWGGNVRELKQTLMRATTNSRGATLEEENLTFTPFDPPPKHLA